MKCKRNWCGIIILMFLIIIVGCAAPISKEPVEQDYSWVGGINLGTVNNNVIKNPENFDMGTSYTSTKEEKCIVHIKSDIMENPKFQYDVFFKYNPEAVLAYCKTIGVENSKGRVLTNRQTINDSHGKPISVSQQYTVNYNSQRTTFVIDNLVGTYWRDANGNVKGVPELADPKIFQDEGPGKHIITHVQKY